MRKLGWVKKACGIFLLCTTAAVALPTQTTGDTPAGPIFTLLHSFDIEDGQFPVAGLVQGTDGNFYGTTTSGGGNSSCSFGCGTVVRMTPRGTLTTLHIFDSTEGDQAAGLVLAIDGNFYGVTEYGGAYGDGTVFRITPSGT